MAKLKLKNVQNDREDENGNILENGVPNYVNDQGYTLFGSGILDNSGNVVEQGWIEIQGGSGTFELEGNPTFFLDYSWGSGDFNLPLPITNGSSGCNTCVSMSFGRPRFGGSEGYVIGNVGDVQSTGINPLTVRWSFEYERFRQTGTVVDWTHPISDSEWGTFTFPFIYHEPENEEE